MLEQIEGLHHVTAMAREAGANNAFFTRTLGLRRVKTTVNFDEPSVYHLYYGNEQGTPGTVMTYFPFPHIGRGRPGTGEVGATAFAVPSGALRFWREHLAAHAVRGMADETRFGEQRLAFDGPDGDRFALVEVADDPRAPWTGSISGEAAIRGFHSVSLRLRDGHAEEELLRLMGYEPQEDSGALRRFVRPGGNGADTMDLELLPDVAPARLGAGSVHHVALSVPTQADQLLVRRALLDAGHAVTPVVDRDYFYAIYFRTPGGVLFEVATGEPGFTRDEDLARLGEALKLPAQHAHLRSRIEAILEPLES